MNNICEACGKSIGGNWPEAICDQCYGAAIVSHPRSIKTQPNERRCGEMVERHEFDLPVCCPISKNPQPGSTIRIKYRPKSLILEVQSIHDYIREYIGGRFDVRSMEGMVQNIAQDCANACRVKVRVTARLILNPPQRMKLTCKAWPND